MCNKLWWTVFIKQKIWNTRPENTVSFDYLYIAYVGDILDLCACMCVWCTCVVDVPVTGQVIPGDIPAPDWCCFSFLLKTVSRSNTDHCLGKNCFFVTCWCAVLIDLSVLDLKSYKHLIMLSYLRKKVMSFVSKLSHSATLCCQWIRAWQTQTAFSRHNIELSKCKKFSLHSHHTNKWMLHIFFWIPFKLSIIVLNKICL